MEISDRVFCLNLFFSFCRNIIFQQAVVAERLRRLTRNQIPSGSVGSNPTDREINFKNVFDLLRKIYPNPSIMLYMLCISTSFQLLWKTFSVDFLLGFVMFAFYSIVIN